MNDDSIATHMHCHVLSVLLTGPRKKKKKKRMPFSLSRFLWNKVLVRWIRVTLAALPVPSIMCLITHYNPS